ncbi:YbjN domain-containing protein [Gemmobacter serpentinus]|uniref:YbjN domain-containing protein n=1 Tax=Gemmobacter serpentinus TaxID=2652247 RepID=UPI00124C3543|nr:YbjN domain-containing protein [Gemmobacter serpentinus]
MKPIFLGLALALVPQFGMAQTTNSVPVPKLVPAQTQSNDMISAGNPAHIVEVMQSLGYRAELTTDDRGDPKIKSAAGGANFSVWFYGCSSGKDCEAIQFSAGFDMENGMEMASVNDWNTRKRYGKVYLDDEQDPYIEMDMMVGTGMSRDLFAENLSLWDRTIADFKDHINW